MRCTKNSATNTDWLRSAAGLQLGQIPQGNDPLERIFDERFNTTLNMLTVGQRQLTSRFFETLASKVVQVFELANSENRSLAQGDHFTDGDQIREHKTS